MLKRTQWGFSRVAPLFPLEKVQLFGGKNDRNSNDKNAARQAQFLVWKSFLVCLFVCLAGGLLMRKKWLLLSCLLPVRRTTGTGATDTIQAIRSTENPARDICYRKKSKMTNSISTVWSPDHMGEWAETFDKISLFCHPDFFNCESKCYWYEIYWAGKGKREGIQHSLPNLDRGTGKYQDVIFKRNVIICLQHTSCVHWHFLQVVLQTAPALNLGTFSRNDLNL